MTGFLRWATGTLVLAAVVHFAVILSYPYLAMRQLMSQIEDQAGGPNRAVFPPRPDPASRRVVRPSPDLLYGICVFDVSRGPLRVRAPAADTYWSLSLFAANTDNFYVVSDVAGGDRWADVVIARFGTDVTEIEQPVVTPPTNRGIVLYRMLIDVPEHEAQLDTRRRQLECEPIVSRRRQ